MSVPNDGYCDTDTIRAEAREIVNYCEHGHEHYQHLAYLLQKARDLIHRDLELERYIAKHSAIFALSSENANEIEVAYNRCVSYGFENEFDEQTMCFIVSAGALDAGAHWLAEKCLDRAKVILDAQRNRSRESVYAQQLEVFNRHVKRLYEVRSHIGPAVSDAEKE